MAENGKLTKPKLQNPEPEMLERLDFLESMEMYEMIRDLGIEKKAAEPVKKSGDGKNEKR